VAQPVPSGQLEIHSAHSRDRVRDDADCKHDADLGCASSGEGELVDGEPDASGGRNRDLFWVLAVSVHADGTSGFAETVLVPVDHLLRDNTRRSIGEWFMATRRRFLGAFRFRARAAVSFVLFVPFCGYVA
jgi:hypothetical protein